MDITFDPAKDRLNIANHGMSLAVAEENHAHRLMALRRTETGNPKRSAGHE